MEAYIRKAEAKGNPETSEIIDHLTWLHIPSSKFIFGLRSIITLKSKFWPRHEAVQKRRDIAPSILKLGTRWKLVVHFRLWPLYLWGLGPKFLLNRRLPGLQSHSGRFGDEENVLLLLENEPLRVQPIP